jgi:hypothetical protein
VEIYGFGGEAQLSFMDFLNVTHKDDADWSHDLEVLPCPLFISQNVPLRLCPIPKLAKSFIVTLC